MKQGPIPFYNEHRELTWPENYSGTCLIFRIKQKALIQFNNFL